MNKIIIIFLCSITLFGLEIDPKIFEEIASKNPQAYKERVILATYYIKHGHDTKAKKFINEVLRIKPNNKDALKLKQLLKIRQHNNEVLKEASLQQPIQKEDAQKRLQSYYDVSNYQFYSNLYQTLLYNKITLDDPYHIKAAYIYLWDKRYELSKEALKRLLHDNNIDEEKIRADICYYQGKYSCAANLYEKLYYVNNDLDYAIKLINSYIYMGETNKAQRLYNVLIRKNPSSKKLQRIGRKLDEIKEKYIQEKKEAYKNNPNETTLKNYAIALDSLARTEENLLLLHQHNAKLATKKSLLLEAKYLTWAGKSEEALKVLESKRLTSDLEAKLMLGKIYSWDNQLEIATKYLDEVIAKSHDEKLLYEAKKALAFVQMWKKQNKLAQKSFLKLQKQNPKDNEVKEALMELSHDYAGLIKIYEKRVRKGGKDADRERLANLYIAHKEPSKAIRYLKQYINTHPENLEATKQLGSLLVNQKDYYQGFGYLEYYTAQKNDANSALYLAKNYNWSGFSKEALDVLNKLLYKYPKNTEALQLKAKILKIAPRFTINNSSTALKQYYGNLGKQQLQIADTLYFNAHYIASLMYYEDYLHNNPTDQAVRLRYAFALEHAALYGKAEGEFTLMLRTQDTDEVRYHYAYNMMKNGKLKEAKKEFNALKNSTYKQLSTSMEEFLKKWETDWESQDFSRYASNYAKIYRDNQMWSFKKQQIFSHVNFIAVSVYNPIYKKLPNGHYKIKFFQDYATNKKSDKGYKTLEVECRNNETECKILKERWQAGKYHKTWLLNRAIENSLQELNRYENNPALLPPKMLSVLNNTSLQNSKKKMNVIKEHKYHDITLAPGLHKDYKTQKLTLNQIYAKANSVNILQKNILALRKQALPTKLNYFIAKGYHFKDSEGVIFNSADLFYKRFRVTNDIDLGVDTGVFSVEEEGVRKHNGIRYGVSFFYKHFSFRLGENNFDNFSEIVPTLQYENSYKNHSYTLKYTRQNGVFYTYRLSPYEDRIKADHFSLSDYVSLYDHTNIWANATANNYSNGDLEMIGQFDWRFYNGTLINNKLTYGFATDGYYTTHTKQHNSFYSPHFNDGTLLRIEPNYKVNKYLNIFGMSGAGYSFQAKQLLYKYGLWFQSDPLEKLSYRLGCTRSNSARSGLSGGGYYYRECRAELEYKW